MKTFFLLLTLLASQACAQQQSVAMLTEPSGGTGSCVIVEREQDSDGGYVGLAVTAYHITGDSVNSKFKVLYFNGRSCSDARLLATESRSDLAVIRTWVPLEIPVATIAAEDGYGVVEIIGYPFGQPGKLNGVKLRTIECWHMSDIEVNPGFSGGGVFRNQQLVGVISGGWFWLKDCNGKQATWPTRSGGLDAIKGIIAKAKSVR